MKKEEEKTRCMVKRVATCERARERDRGRERTEFLLSSKRKTRWSDLSMMGCRVCTLQKPQEQYKLLYEVCQVTVLFYLSQKVVH